MQSGPKQAVDKKTKPCDQWPRCISFSAAVVAAALLDAALAQLVASGAAEAGVTEAVDDVHSVVWNKLLINIGINAEG